MSRNRSSSFPPAIATPAAPFSVHLRNDSVMQRPLVIARSISANTDAPIPPPLDRIELNAGLGPIRKRSASDPTSAVRVSTHPPVRKDGETLSASRDEESRSSDESIVEDAWGSVRSKDAVRRYHALKELLATEYGYLEDLRFLVTVYLRNLPTLVMRSLCSTSTFASFTTGPSSSWMHSSTSHASSITGHSTELSNMPTPQSTSSYSKAPSSRFLFTDHEVELLTRNGEEILQLHEHFVKDLYMVLEPLGFSSGSDESKGPREPHVADLLQLANVDEAIRVVSTKFSTEASRFNVYQPFCAGHPEAMDVLRKALQQFPVELDLFEQRSSSIVPEMLGSKNKLLLREASSSTQKLPAGSKDLSVHAIMPPALEDRKRTLSLTSLDDRKDSKLKASSPKSLKLRASMTAITTISTSRNNREKEDTLVRSLPDDRTSFDLQRSATTSSGGTNVSEVTKLKERDKSFGRKIAMADYMIKPVQRICKYPLLLDQLLPSKALRDVARNGVPNVSADVVVLVESAAQAMRRVAASVDAARERQSIATQSSLIFSRICLGLQVQGMLPSGSISHSYSGSPPYPISSSSRSSGSTQTQNSPQPRLPTPTFLSSLGPCLLSGSLDVIHYSHPVNAWLTGAIKGKIKMKAKYLGAFLYDGGYLIFVKAGKGRRYEPRHWFALDGWDIVSIGVEEAMLPHSFRLSKTGQHFEVAASCAREKDVWLASISGAIQHVATWIGEPMPSFMCDGRKYTVESTPPSAPGSDDGHSESVDVVEEGLTPSSGDVGGLPTICSIPDVCETYESALESEPRVARTEPFFASLREHVHGRSGRKKRLSTMSGGGSKRHPQPSQLDEEPPSRRSSSTSVMNIFSPIHVASYDREKERDRERETETVLITRSSATARHAIDSELQDVISVSCASARADAAWREKVDVGQGAASSVKAKTSTSIAMGSMSRGMARLSKHESVRVPRKRTSVTIETLNRSAAPSASTKGTTGRKNVKKLSLTSFSSTDYDKSTNQDDPTLTTTSSPHDSSSHASTENLSVIPISATFISVSSDTKPSRSFVQNVKDLFHFRPAITAPVSVIVSHPTQSSLQSMAYMDVLQRENKAATKNSCTIYPVDGLLKSFAKDSSSPHGKNVTGASGGDDFDFVTITSIHEADENMARDKFSMAMPVMATPMRVI